MKFILSLFIFSSCILNGYSQKVFFKSKQSFTETQLKDFYSSVTVFNEWVLFNANDYTIYAYDSRTLNQLWATETKYKTNIPVFVDNYRIYAGVYENKGENTAVFDAEGKRLKVLSVGPLATRPFIKDKKLYGTALYEGGCLFEYDLFDDSVTWYRFTAHGMSTQTNFDEKEMLANAEGDNWFRIGYNGRLMDTSCKEKADIFVQDIPCIRNFVGLTHDKKEMTSVFIEKLFPQGSSEELQIYHTDKSSILLSDDQLVVLGDKLKKKVQIAIPDLSDSVFESEGSARNQILRGDDKQVWLLYNGWLLSINHSTKKVETQINLNPWSPHQVVLSGERVWVISRKDGLLYGIAIGD